FCAVSAVAARGISGRINRIERIAMPAVRSAHLFAGGLPLSGESCARGRDRSGGAGDRSRRNGSHMTTEATSTAGAWPNAASSAVLPAAPLERAACLTLLAFAAMLQVSIAAAQIFLAIATVLWLGLLIRNHERFEAPPMFWP